EARVVSAFGRGIAGGQRGDQRALGKAFERVRVDRAGARHVHRRLDPIAGETGTGADYVWGWHCGFTKLWGFCPESMRSISSAAALAILALHSTVMPARCGVRITLS